MKFLIKQRVFLFYKNLSLKIFYKSLIFMFTYRRIHYKYYKSHNNKKAILQDNSFSVIGQNGFFTSYYLSIWHM